MIIKDAKVLATQWVRQQAAAATPGFGGACYSGSVPWLAEGDELPASSDVDIMVVADPVPPNKLGKFRYQGLLLDVSYLPVASVRDPERVLGDYRLAGSFRHPNVIMDRDGQLARLQAAVARRYADPSWVRRRCAHARDIVRDRLRRLDRDDPLPRQVAEWALATGQTAHLLLVAGLRNPTVRRRYGAVRELLAEQGRLDVYEWLLELLGCAQLPANRVRRHLAALASAFDDTAPHASTAPFFFASDLTEDARPVVIDGSAELIDSGLHREAVFWMLVTLAKCQQLLDHAAAEPVRRRHEQALRELLADLGLGSIDDLHQRARRVAAQLPRVWDVAEQILATCAPPPSLPETGRSSTGERPPSPHEREPGDAGGGSWS